MVRVFIAEDEIGTLNSILNIVTNYCPGTIVIGAAENVVSSVQFLQENKVDLVLLDINFPDGTGFDILNQLDSFNFKIIFITAFEEYALKAIKFSASDYLLKPINPKELISSVKKLGDEIQKEAQNHNFNSLNIQALLSNLKNEGRKNKKIVLRTLERIHVVDINTIVRCESDRSYTTFYIENGQSVIVSRNLIEYDELLADYGFIRTHKSHLVNIDSILSFEKAGGGFLLLKDNSKIPVSVRKKDMVLNALNNI